MSTTIQVNDDTMVRLKLMKEQFHAPSYDELLRILMRKAVKPKRSLAGAGGHLDWNEVMKDLRDKSDRY